MKIVNAVCCKGMTGFFFDDQRAIKGGAKSDGNAYIGDAVTRGFTNIRQAGESVSILLVLEDGSIAHGDCAAVQYSGAGGRDDLFLAKDYIPYIEKYIFPEIIGQQADSFKLLAKKIDSMRDDNGRLIHTAVRYGVTQALLDAVAKSKKTIMANVIAKEYGTEVLDREIPIFTQSGDDRYLNSDKMILKGAAVLPHALINNVEKKLGYKGEKLIEYVSWLRDRVCSLAVTTDYKPVMHIDVYGTLGLAFDYDFERMVTYLGEIEKAAAPFTIRIEGPVDMEGREKQIEALAKLRRMTDERGITTEIVADEWCNTLEDIRLFADHKAGHMLQIKTPDLGGINNTAEAVLYCKDKGIGAYQGGTCNETDRSAQVCVHVAMATAPDQILAKPGMGVDEGFMIVYNEMQRILALRKGGLR